MQRLVRAIDRFSHGCGVVSAGLVIALIVLMLYDVGMRYIANAPTLWGYDVNTFLMGAAFVLSLGYALSRDAHVRVDLLYAKASRQRLVWVDLAGFTLFVLPALAWITAGLWDYFATAYASGERSGSSAWNPVLWPFRFVLFAGFVALAVQVVAEILKRVIALRGAGRTPSGGGGAHGR